MAGEIEESGGLDVVEMVEDAGLVAAEDLLSLGVADVPFVAGEVDLRVAAEDGVYFGPGHGWEYMANCLVSQIKLFRKSELRSDWQAEARPTKHKAEPYATRERATGPCWWPGHLL